MVAKAKKPEGNDSKVTQHFGDHNIKLTWAAVRGWAAANEVPDDALVVDADGDASAYDLDCSEPDDGDPSRMIIFFRK